jgi:Asp-tRNA(Asn)/Glu-tRNA(Gln) amidotransferase A subunit family amidase
MPSVADIVALTERGAASARDIVDAALARAHRVQVAFNAFTVIRTEQALHEAEALDRLPADARGPLHGVPVAIKDLTPTRGDPTTRGSRAFADHVSERDAEIVRRLRAAGAVVIAKTTTPEFAHSAFTRSPLWGETLNPWDPTRTSGGSSGGSAVAVATDCVPIAEGSDMGGSVRIPAALCGIVGLKPSLGRIPMDVLATGFDLMSHFGPLAGSIADAQAFLRATEGPSWSDPMSFGAYKPLPPVLSGVLRGLRIAASEDLGFFAVQPDVLAQVRASLAALREAGAVVESVALPWQTSDVGLWLKLWGVLLAAEAADIVDAWRDRMDPDLIQLIDEARTMGAVEYKLLERRRTALWHELGAVLSTHDALVCPTMAVTAPAANLRDEDFMRVDQAGRLHGMDMTSLFNLTGQCPALSVPSGLGDDGLPTAVQIVGRPGDDPTVLAIGLALEQRRPWPRISPDRIRQGSGKDR